ncbi:MAG: O-antigen ligase family protein [Lachnospiraceae bacterium]|nr:O-antigen ligase family protein [Lachnospiraceae bacterium]
MKLFKSDSKYISGVVAIYTALKPLYLFGSGSLQICDLFFAVMLLWWILSGKGKILIKKEVFPVVRLLAILVFYQAVVNVVWFTVTHDTGMISKTLINVFNMLMFCFCIIIERTVGSENLKRSFALGCFWSSLLTAVGMVLARGLSARNTGFFNNPNQLGYYAVVLFSAVLLWHAHFTVAERRIVLLISIWAVLASGSKAAMIGLAVMIIFRVVWGPKKISGKQLAIRIFALLAVFAVAYFFLYSQSSLITSNGTLSFMRSRILNMAKEKDSDLGKGRGYSRVFEMGNNYLWGVGEGGYNRFEALRGKEVHSTYVSFFVSYGVIGSLLFLMLLKRLLWRPGLIKRNIIGLSGIALYSLTHNGIRNTLVWIVLAILYLESMDPNRNIDAREVVYETEESDKAK